MMINLNKILYSKIVRIYIHLSLTSTLMRVKINLQFLSVKDACLDIENDQIEQYPRLLRPAGQAA